MDPRPPPTGKAAFSIIVPTLREEAYIGSLLESLAVQTRKDFEVIVVDAGSEDRTREVVESFQGRFQRLCFITETRRGLGRARNVGAAEATADCLVFLEADCVVEPDFFHVILGEIRERGLGCANVLSSPLSDRRFDRLYYKLLLDYFIRMAQFISPVITGYFIYVTRPVFDRLNGFRDTITFEDTDFAKRARKVTRFRILKRRRIFTSVRRLESDGRMKSLVRSFLVTMYQFVFGAIPINHRLYPFGHHRMETPHERIVKKTLHTSPPSHGKKGRSP